MIYLYNIIPTKASFIIFFIRDGGNVLAKLSLYPPIVPSHTTTTTSPQVAFPPCPPSRHPSLFTHEPQQSRSCTIVPQELRHPTVGTHHAGVSSSSNGIRFDDSRLMSGISESDHYPPLDA